MERQIYQGPARDIRREQPSKHLKKEGRNASGAIYTLIGLAAVGGVLGYLALNQGETTYDNCEVHNDKTALQIAKEKGITDGNTSVRIEHAFDGYNSSDQIPLSRANAKFDSPADRICFPEKNPSQGNPNNEKSTAAYLKTQLKGA